MTLRKGDIPATAHSVTIRNMQHLILEEDVIGDLPSLVNLTVSDVGQLEIKRDGMASHNQTRLRSVLFQNVQSLQAESHSFSGVWQSETTIRMHHIENLHVMSGAFSYQASITGPSVSLQHVHSLDLESSGFSAPMFSMSLTNVTMDDCQEHSFGGSAYYTEWNTVKVKGMRAKCFHGQNALGSFTINSLSVESTYPGSFYGDVQELRVENSHLGTIQGESFNLTVSSMEISKSSIGELHSKGLKVLARESFKLDVIRVNQLRKDAFLGVQMVRGADGFSPAFKIRKMEVMETENGSLTFSPCTEVRISELDVTAPLPPICPTERWTRALSAGGVAGQLSQAQYELFFVLLDRRWCDEDAWTPFPDSADNPQCQPTGQETGDDAPGGGTGDPDTAQDSQGGIEQQDSNKGGKEDEEDVKADEDNASRLADGDAPAKDDDDDKMAYYSWDDYVANAASLCRLSLDL
ncbi:hypothetical protein FJT64_005126 [Amphibalanus amphitrite]|uniref:Uncharacterized protein n=1 Tax=Amphibalanus amphitrite TaxID=1232801 RepID=A0A6A4VTI0_AMPAM|nr:hypothetical protein FJT64_005126 [Amphibalanus amphitrite]